MTRERGFVCGVTDDLRKEVLSLAERVPEMPVALVGMRRRWWGCVFDLDRFERTGRFDPRAMWGDRATVGEVATSEVSAAEDARESIRIWSRLIVKHHAQGNAFAADSAARIIEQIVELSAIGPAVPIDPELARLVADHLRGALPARRGRKVAFSNWRKSAPWIVRNILPREFAERRLAGEKYDALVAEYARGCGLSRSTIEALASPEKSGE